MIARHSKLRHPAGVSIETPLLVPSFSSKGFGFDGRGMSEVQKIHEVAREYLTEAMLVSAYDLHHGHLEEPTGAITEITFVDSGGYETSDLKDLSDTFITTTAPKTWTPELHHETLERWPDHIPAVFVSFDSADDPQPLGDQIAQAKEMAGRYPKQMSAILVKPETKDQKFIQIPNVLAAVEDLSGFSIIGLTEKELGNSFLKRMENISKVRLELDDAGIRSPIHVFGSLDPISICLYFLSGAEIFDGLSWLRYGFLHGDAVYRHNFAARTIGLQRRDDFVKTKTMQDNLNYLSDLTTRMRRFLNDGDFAALAPNDGLLHEAFELLRTKNARVA